MILVKASEEQSSLHHIGMDSFGRVLVVVYTWRNDEIRLISARKATRHEQKQYEEGCPQSYTP